MGNNARQRSQPCQAAEDHTHGPLGPPLLTAGDVGRLLSCSQRTVYRLADSGRIPPPVKLGALSRWPRRAIEQWIAEGCPHRARRGPRL